MKKQTYPSFANFISVNFKNMEKYMRSEFQPSWVGGGLYSTADTLIHDIVNCGGALPPIQKLYKADDLTLKSSEASAPQYIFDVYGESFDIGLVCEGVPEAWLCQQEIPTHKENLTIRILHGVSGSVDNREATEKYMAVADLYRAALTKYRVRVVIEWHAVADGNVYHHEVMISDFTDYLDPLTLVSMCSITMFRTIMNGLSGMAAGKQSNIVDWPREWKKYFSSGTQTFAERVETINGDEIILPPIHQYTNGCFDIKNLLKAAGLAEGE